MCDQQKRTDWPNRPFPKSPIRRTKSAKPCPSPSLVSSSSKFQGPLGFHPWLRSAQKKKNGNQGIGCLFFNLPFEFRINIWSSGFYFILFLLFLFRFSLVNRRSNSCRLRRRDRWQALCPTHGTRCLPFSSYPLALPSLPSSSCEWIFWYLIVNLRAGLLVGAGVSC